MKLAEILTLREGENTVEKEALEWLQQFKIFSSVASPLTPLAVKIELGKLAVIKDGRARLNPDIKKLELELHKPDVFYWGLDPEVNKSLDLTISIQTQETFTVDGFEGMPSCNKLDLVGAEVKSWDGIEKMINLEQLHLGDDTTFDDTRLLKILKAPKLQSIAYNTSIPYDLREDEDKAIEIINKHLKDKDIAKCVDELHDEGLEEFAKL